MTHPLNEQPDAAPASNEDEGEQLVLTSPEDARTPKELALWGGVILLVALTVYSPALRGDFLWDDDRHVSANRHLRDGQGLANIWTKIGPKRGGTVQYYPLTHTTFWLEYQLSGAQPGQINTTVFHVTNVVLHAISAILLWLVLRELKVPGSWVAAAIWALHPVQVESVAWISERKNVLAGVFFFGAILAYLRSAMGLREGAGPRKFDGLYFLALGLYACALLSKSATVSMPAVVLLLLWWKRGVTAKDWLATAPFFAIGLGMAALTAWIERTQVGAHGPEWAAISPAQRVLIAGRAIWFYIEKLILPVRLGFIYPRWTVVASNIAWWFFPAAVMAVGGIFFALRKRIGRGPIVAFLIFCGVLVPALGFFDFYPMRYSFVADHFQYLAGPALIALLVAAGTVALRKIAPRAQAAPYVVAGLALVVLSALTLMRASVYDGPLLLWADAIKTNPRSPMLRYNYGVDLMVLMDQLPPKEAAPFVDEAMKQFEAAVALDPQHDRAWTRWGRSLVFRDQPEEALAKFAAALKIRPDNVDALMGRGRALYELKRFDESQAAFQEALTAAQAQRGTGGIPRIVAATIYQYLGRIAVAKNDYESAANDYLQAVSIEPNSSMMHYEYGQVLARLAKLADGATTQPATTAATTQRIATTLPATTRSATQPSEKAKKLLAAAAQQLAAAIEIRPDYIDARIALANLMMDVGNLPGANTQLAAAVRSLREGSAQAAYAPLKEAVDRWDAEFRKREAAATRPATTRATTAATAPTPSSR
ncbi:MAG: hypothetical protein QOE14_2868 [Humisphaera sp.]|nr:hypothetical protein [Humisphaera sp.]